MVTDYIDGFVFENDTLKYFAAAEGRVRVSGATLTNEYVITDTQGNSRVSFEDNGSGVAVVRQENGYYPFGLVMSNGITPSTQPNKNLYNGGSEWQNDYVDLPDYYQTFFRNYDAAIGRFVGVDPQAESADSMTPYQYAYNNPGMLNDPMGDIINLQAQANYDAQNAPRAVSHYDWREAEMRANEEANWSEAQRWYYVNGFGGYGNGVADQIAAGNGFDLGGGRQILENFTNSLRAGSVSITNSGLFFSSTTATALPLTEEDIQFKVNTSIRFDVTIKFVPFKGSPHASTNAKSPTSYYDKALELAGSVYGLGFSNRTTCDCSGTVVYATGVKDPRYTSNSGKPPGNWNQVYPNTSSFKSFTSELRRGDLLVFPNPKGYGHIAWWMAETNEKGRPLIFNAHGDPGKGITQGTTTLPYFIDRFKRYPDVYRQSR